MVQHLLARDGTHMNFNIFILAKCAYMEIYTSRQGQNHAARFNEYFDSTYTCIFIPKKKVSMQD